MYMQISLALAIAWIVWCTLSERKRRIQAQPAASSSSRTQRHLGCTDSSMHPHTTYIGAIWMHLTRKRRWEIYVVTCRWSTRQWTRREDGKFVGDSLSGVEGSRVRVCVCVLRLKGRAAWGDGGSGSVFTRGGNFHSHKNRKREGERERRKKGTKNLAPQVKEVCVRVIREIGARAPKEASWGIREPLFRWEMRALCLRNDRVGMVFFFVCNM